MKNKEVIKIRVKKMDEKGHSCLSEKGGQANWHTGRDSDVSFEFGKSVVNDYVQKGYFIVDEARSKIVSVKELRGESDILLMPPIVGG